MSVLRSSVFSQWLDDTSVMLSEHYDQLHDCRKYLAAMNIEADLSAIDGVLRHICDARQSIDDAWEEFDNADIPKTVRVETDESQ